MSYVDHLLVRKYFQYGIIGASFGSCLGHIRVIFSNIVASLFLKWLLCIQDMSSDIFRTFSDQIECKRFYPRLKQGRDSKILIEHLLFVKQIFWLFSIMDLHKSLWTFSESLLIKPSMEYVDSRYIVMLWIDLNQNGYAEWFWLIPEIPWDLPLPPLNFEWFMKVSSIICSTAHLFPGMKDLVTLMRLNFIWLSVFGCESSMLTMNMQK